MSNQTRTPSAGAPRNGTIPSRSPAAKMPAGSQAVRRAVPEGRTRLSFLIESELEKAELVIAVKAITDKLQDMAEDLAKIEADDIMPMQDSLRTAFGAPVAEQFSKTATEQVRQLVSAISGAKDAIGNEVTRLEQAVNGGATNDMAMGGDAGGNDMASNDLGGGDQGGDGLGGGGDAGGSPDDDPMGSDAGGASDGESGQPDESELDSMLGSTGSGMGDDDGGVPPPPMSAAGRAKKESAMMRGRRLVEFTHTEDFQTSVQNLATFDPRAGALAHGVHDMIDNARLDGPERTALTQVLTHLAACASDVRHWEDPDAKVDTALRATHIDLRLPEMRAIVGKLKKLAHFISLKHDAMVESRRQRRNADQLREARDPDAVILASFRRALRETSNAARAVARVATSYLIDAADVVAIVREAKRARRHGRVSGAKPAMRMPTPRTPISRKPTPQRSMREADTTTQAAARQPSRQAVTPAARPAASRPTAEGRGRPSAQSPEPGGWRDIIEADARRVNEQQPTKPKSPADLRAERAVMQQQQGAGGTQSAARGVPTNAPANRPANAQAKPQGNTKRGNPVARPVNQAQRQANQTAQGQTAQGQTAQGQTAQGRAVQGQAPAQSAGAPPAANVSPQQQAKAQQQQTGLPANQAPPVAADGTAAPRSTPVGQSPQKPEAVAAAPDMPGKIVKQIPAKALPANTLMSKPTPFPKPGPPLMGTAPKASSVGEGRQRPLPRSGAKRLVEIKRPVGSLAGRAKPAARSSTQPPTR